MITNRFRNARNTEHTPTFRSKRGTVAANWVPRKTKPSITMAIPERRLGWKRCLYRYNFLSIFGWFIWYVVRNTTLPKEILQSVQFVLLNSQTQRIPETRRIISLPLFASKDKFMIHEWTVLKSHATVIFPCSGHIVEENFKHKRFFSSQYHFSSTLSARIIWKAAINHATSVCNRSCWKQTGFSARGNNFWRFVAQHRQGNQPERCSCRAPWTRSRKNSFR